MAVTPRRESSPLTDPGTDVDVDVGTTDGLLSDVVDFDPTGAHKRKRRGKQNHAAQDARKRQRRAAPPLTTQDSMEDGGWHVARKVGYSLSGVPGAKGGGIDSDVVDARSALHPTALARSFSLVYLCVAQDGA